MDRAIDAANAPPNKVGYLKHDIYRSKYGHSIPLTLDIKTLLYALTHDQKEKIIADVLNELDNMFEIQAVKGTKFYRRPLWWGGNLWFSEDITMLRFMLPEWAEVNLENIEDYNEDT